MNVKLLSNILFYGIKRNPAIVVLWVDVNMFHEGWQSILLLIFRREIDVHSKSDFVFLKAAMPSRSC